MTRVVGQVRYNVAPGAAMERPAVHEQEVWALAHLVVAELACADVEMGLSGHRASLGWLDTPMKRYVGAERTYLLR